MIALPLILLVLGVLATALVVVPLILREVRAMRRAGMSHTTPVCAACHYPLGGWSSSKCPECGQDARTHRVRVSLSSIRPIRYGLIVVALFIGAPIAFLICAFTLQISYRGQHVTVDATAPVAWSARVGVEERWRSASATPSRVYRVTFLRSGVASSPTLETDDPADPAFGGALDTALTALLGPAAASDPQSIAEARSAIDTMLTRAAALPPRFDPATYASIAPGGAFTVNGSGYSSGGRLYTATYLVWGAAVLVLIALCIPAARVIGDDGTRPVRDREWDLAGRGANE